ncbi:hypothetical protein A464_864 [Salmonella bongori N268-08]|uniref:Uncharacterized protein n=1 Tax=Salmonella bongori N268-08 TaxID=1197719 RepID=S5N6E0_SALBN|nr:hypothetical protein A464_864 [Salmonella bongori N268-08]
MTAQTPYSAYRCHVGRISAAPPSGIFLFMPPRLSMKNVITIFN